MDNINERSRTNDPATWSKRVHQWALLLAAIFTAYGSWRTFLLNEEKTWQQEDAQFRSEWLQGQQLKERLLYEKQLRAKADEIASLNKTIAGAVTGGDSFCYLSVMSNSPREPLRFVIVHLGKFPLYDVS